ncbi:hypothetical protein NWI01_35790 [Nitrobacter winogradskyi]|uniref:Uncharacterized protein n=1 Tax=Nitrobacter winogradskyi TaxID=913 RepID=A0A4Y3WF97_NITWI|nr:hypothetical protein NWI01_35790 [Nitrobacter winogradskyi]
MENFTREDFWFIVAANQNLSVELLDAGCKKLNLFSELYQQSKAGSAGDSVLFLAPEKH